MNDEGMKITDKRMFDAEGELREEFRFLDEEDKKEVASEEPPAASASNESELADQPEMNEQPPEPGPEARADLGENAPPEGAPSFYDLVALLAEPVALYMGDAKLPEGESVENLEMARLYIDLLKILQEKTAGNLSADEKALIDDLVYRFQMRYVQKRG